MKNQIIKVTESVEFSIATKLSKDLGLFQVDAWVYSTVFPQYCNAIKVEGGYTQEINDLEFTFSINNKECISNGFKELYEKLYGKDSYRPFYHELREEFENACLKLSTYKTIETDKN
tara:strand:+ start:46 stop:396 length:351 start_codon:yes stop_codon:yes gene_type:complete